MSSDYSLPPGVRDEGWYPDPKTGGTRYWDGQSWTGDSRPPRRRFAAESSPGCLALLALLGGCAAIIAGCVTLLVPVIGLPLLLLGIAGFVYGVYLMRGKGPSTMLVKHRLAQEELERGRRAEADQRTRPAELTIQLGAPLISDEAVVRAAQIEALSDPDTAQALQNLQNLLYTRTITDAEFQAAKDQLLGGKTPEA